MTVDILVGDCRDVLKTLPDESVQCVVTSPPYWGLRDYGTAQWEGGDEACEHKVGRFEYPVSEKQFSNSGSAGHQARDVCPKCGARRIDSQLGLEPTPGEYVAAMVAVFREVRRVLRADGVMWVNLGSSYASGDMRANQSPRAHREQPCDTDDITQSSSQGIDHVYPHYDDEHPGETQNHHARTPHNVSAPRESDEHLYRISHDSVPGDCAPSSHHGASASVPTSTILSSSGYAQGVLSLADEVSEHQTELPTNAGDAVQFSHKAENTSGTVLLQHFSVDRKTDKQPSYVASSAPPTSILPYYSTMFSDMQFKPKDMIPIPWMIAMALQADGWYLRSDCIWAKPNPMPESVTDRPTKSHEYVFLLTKSTRYYYDQEAVREPQVRPEDNGKALGWGRVGNAEGMEHYAPGSGTRQYNPAGRNLRDVWTIPTFAYPGSHFATYPPALVEPCVKAGTSEKGCCPRCGKPWERVVEVNYSNWTSGNANGKRKGGGIPKERKSIEQRCEMETTTTGWRPGCECDAGEPVACTVLDPFGGAGTTGLVADRLGRHAILIELNADYAAMAERRIREDNPMFTQVKVR